MLEKRTPAPVATGAGARDRQAVSDGRKHSTVGRNSKLARQLERITADDRQWFERPPKRLWRVRPPLPGEAPAEQVAVRSFGPATLRVVLSGEPEAGLTEPGLDLLVRSSALPRHVRLFDIGEATIRKAAIEAGQ